MITSPVSRSKAQAKQSYNRLSRWYDFFSNGSEARYRRLGLEALQAQPGEMVLEIGFGTGQALLELARCVGSGGCVEGLDLSDGMLTVAQARLAKAGLAGQVHLQVGDAAALPYPPACFNAIFMSFTLELFDTPEISLVLRQCWQALRPGGRLLVVALVQSSPPGMAERLYEWFHTRLPSVVDCRPIPARVFIQEAGFSVVEVSQYSMWGLPVEVILAGKR